MIAGTYEVGISSNGMAPKPSFMKVYYMEGGQTDTNMIPRSCS